MPGKTETGLAFESATSDLIGGFATGVEEVMVVVVCGGAGTLLWVGGGGGGGGAGVALGLAGTRTR